MQLKEEHREWVEALQVGDPVQVGMVSGGTIRHGTLGITTTGTFTIHPEFMRAEVTAVSPDEIEIKSLQTGEAHTFTASGISKTDATLALWKEGMQP